MNLHNCNECGNVDITPTCLNCSEFHKSVNREKGLRLAREFRAGMDNEKVTSNV